VKTVIMTVDGDYYEIDREVIEQYRLPNEVTDAHLKSLRESVRIDPRTHFESAPAAARGRGRWEDPT
jgi:hypothetical protein